MTQSRNQIRTVELDPVPFHKDIVEYSDKDSKILKLLLLNSKLFKENYRLRKHEVFCAAHHFEDSLEMLSTSASFSNHDLQIFSDLVFHHQAIFLLHKTCGRFQKFVT